jgi:hypothetical protein
VLGDAAERSLEKRGGGGEILLLEQPCLASHPALPGELFGDGAAECVERSQIRQALEVDLDPELLTDDAREIDRAHRVPFLHRVRCRPGCVFGRESGKRDGKALRESLIEIIHVTLTV